jgi:hypothetical protein
MPSSVRASSSVNHRDEPPGEALTTLSPTPAAINLPGTLNASAPAQITMSACGIAGGSL